MRKGQKGFTLVELLLVIAIIGMLASIVMITVSQARQKGRDAIRIAEGRSVETALEIYYNDHNRYPTWHDENDPIGNWSNMVNELQSGGYFTKAQQNPNNALVLTPLEKFALDFPFLDRKHTPRVA
jgi:general secretion pathway protein G